MQPLGPCKGNNKNLFRLRILKGGFLLPYLHGSLDCIVIEISI